MLQKYSARALRRQWQLYHGVSRVAVGTTSSFGRYTYPVRGFHSTQRLRVVKPVLLADIGEGQKPLYPHVSLLCVTYNQSIADTDPLIHTQASSNVKSYNGSLSPRPESKNSRHYAKSRVTRPLWRLPAASQASSKSCTMRPVIWPKWASRLWT